MYFAAVYFTISAWPIVTYLFKVANYEKVYNSYSWVGGAGFNVLYVIIGRGGRCPGRWTEPARALPRWCRCRPARKDGWTVEWHKPETEYWGIWQEQPGYETTRNKTGAVTTFSGRYHQTHTTASEPKKRRELDYKRRGAALLKCCAPSF